MFFGQYVDKTYIFGSWKIKISTSVALKIKISTSVVWKIKISVKSVDICAKLSLTSSLFAIYIDGMILLILGEKK